MPSFSSSSPASKLILLLPCILILSSITTIIILYIIGYKDEIQFMYSESKDILFSSSLLNIRTVQQSKDVMRYLYGHYLWLVHSSSFVTYDSKQEVEDYKNYTIYDINDLFDHDDGNHHKDDEKSINFKGFGKQCREKGALKMKNNTTEYPSSSATSCRSIVTKEMMDSFHKDGVIAIRGLLSKELFDNLNTSSYDVMQEQLKKVGFKTMTGKQFFMNKLSPAFMNDHKFQNDHNSDEQSSFTINNELPSSGFRDVALSSLIPQVAAELMGMQYNDDDDDDDDDDANDQDPRNFDGQTVEEQDNLRLLRDVFLVKDADKFICGWHVDDLFFWPTTASSPGINAWVAIDDMSTSTGGNFAVSVGTHDVPWKEEVYKLTGSTMTLPREGYKDVYDMFQNRRGAGTCNIKNVAVELHDKLEERKRVYDLKAGDVLFMTRWLFHRTIPYHRDVVKEKKKYGELNQLLSRRYSIRYSPGSSELLRGYNTELSMLWNEDNQGRTLNTVAKIDGPWYPKCWPYSTSDMEQREIQSLMKDKFPIAEKIRKEKVNEMKPLLQQIGQQQHNKQKVNAVNMMKQRPRGARKAAEARERREL